MLMDWFENLWVCESVCRQKGHNKNHNYFLVCLLRHRLNSASQMNKLIDKFKPR